MRVFVYYNLHKHIWSIKALDGQHRGRVIGHAKAVELSHAVCKVSEAGRQRVLLERRKNVHAGITGELHSVTGYESRNLPTGELPCFVKGTGPWGVSTCLQGFESVTYNPFKAPLFYLRNDPSRAVLGGMHVTMLGDRSVWAFDVVTQQMAVAATGELFAA